jgi:hypothetical protein
MPFEDIKILHIDVAKTVRSAKDPKLHSIFLKLSAVPSPKWIECFAATRFFPRNIVWRKAWIEGEYIQTDCLPAEIAKFHGQDLAVDVAAANKNYRAALEKAEGQAQSG